MATNQKSTSGLSQQAAIKEAVKPLPRYGWCFGIQRKLSQNDPSAPDGSFNHQLTRTLNVIRIGMRFPITTQQSVPHAILLPNPTDRHTPRFIEFVKIVLHQIHRAFETGGQVGRQKTIPQLIQTVRSAEDNLASKMKPIQHRLLLLSVQFVGREIVPKQIGDRCPSHRISRNRQRIFWLRNNDLVKRLTRHRRIKTFHGRHPHTVDFLQITKRVGPFGQHDQMKLARVHQRMGLANIVLWDSRGSTQFVVDCRRTKRQISFGQINRRLHVFPLALSQCDWSFRIRVKIGAQNSRWSSTTFDWRCGEFSIRVVVVRNHREMNINPVARLGAIAKQFTSLFLLLFDICIRVDRLGKVSRKNNWIE